VDDQEFYQTLLDIYTEAEQHGTKTTRFRALMTKARKGVKERCSPSQFEAFMKTCSKH
jgi:hypothetical protein